MSEHRDPVWQSEADASIADAVRAYAEAVQADAERIARHEKYVRALMDAGTITREEYLYHRRAERDRCTAIVRAAKERCER